MSGAALYELTARTAASIRATDDERADAIQWMLVKVAERHGWNVPASELSVGYLHRRMSGRIADERAAAERRNDSRAWAAVADAESESDDERQHRIDRNVWAAFQAPPLVGQIRAAQLGAEYLADELGVAESDERLALVYALAERGQRDELAAALGIAEDAFHKRLSRGRAELRKRWPNAAELTAAMLSVQAPSDDERVTLSAELWAASELVESVRCATYRLHKSGALPTAPVGAGRWHEGTHSAPANRRAHYRATASTAEPSASDESRATALAVKVRRSDAYRAERSEKVRAAMLADALAELSAELAERKRTAAEPRRFSAPSAAPSMGTVADALAAADAGRRRRRAAVLRAELAAQLVARQRAELRKRWLCVLAAHKLTSWQRAARR